MLRRILPAVEYGTVVVRMGGRASVDDLHGDLVADPPHGALVPARIGDGKALIASGDGARRDRACACGPATLRPVLVVARARGALSGHVGGETAGCGAPGPLDTYG